MGHDHGHRATTTALRWALYLNGAFLVIEATLGLITGSLALLSDAAHMVNDVGALAIALGAAHLSRKLPAGDRTYGYRRIEVVAGFVSGLLLVLAAIVIAKTAISRLVSGAPTIAGTAVLVAGVVGLAINVGSAWYLHRSGRHDNLNIRAALTHMLADALGSVAAIAAALFMLAGYPAADSILSLVTAVLIVVVAGVLVRDALRVLMQFSPPQTSCERIRDSILEVDGVEDVHDLHVWSVDGDESVLTAHVVGERGVRARVERILVDRHGIDHTTIQEETTDPCAGPCSLFADEH
jgi:cobalt-zinc-cadmium efflux system protein